MHFQDNSNEAHLLVHSNKELCPLKLHHKLQIKSKEKRKNKMFEERVYKNKLCREFKTSSDKLFNLFLKEWTEAVLNIKIF